MTKDGPRPRVLFFVKFPEPGKVKTRLARTIGDPEAARLYRLLAETNIASLKFLAPAELELRVVYDPAAPEQQFKNWLGGALFYEAQEGNDLGERMSRAFGSAFSGSTAPALAVGSDTIGLKASLLRQALAALQKHDVVLGPARDGGYYLIGLIKPVAQIFRDIPWSTPEVLDATVKKAAALGLSVHLLPVLEDLDTASNLEGALRAIKPALSPSIPETPGR